jgi:probable HAF family extracellular repeat protein
MKTRILTCITAMTLFAALAVPVRLGAQEQEQKQDLRRYTVIDLGILGGGTFSWAEGVSNNGWVKGRADTTLPGEPVERAFLWRNGVMTDLGTLGGPNSFTETGTVFDSGDVVGAAESSTTDPLNENWCGFNDNLKCLPFLWRNDVRKMIPLPTLGGNNGWAMGINNQDAVTGQVENATTDTTCPPFLQIKPVIWINGHVQELPTLPGDPDGVAAAINDWGQIAGNSGNCTDGASSHALLWQNGRAIDLGNLGGTTNNIGTDINNLAQVIGYSDLPGDTTYDAFLWQKRTGMIDLGTLPGDFGSGALGINNEGQVAGGSWDAEGNERAFLWQNGVMTDLNTLIPPDSPWFLWEADGINDQGQIVGLAYQSSTGDWHAFLATPTTGYWAIRERPRVVLPENVRKLVQQLRRGRFGHKLTTPQ